jgi:hypothetical protein
MRTASSPAPGVRGRRLGVVVTLTAGEIHLLGSRIVGRGGIMAFTSPLPSVSLPAVPLTPYILERASRLATKTAFIDGLTGRTLTYG